jgi:hypothetical protein
MHTTCLVFSSTEYNHINGQYRLRRRDDQWCDVSDVIASNFCSHNKIVRSPCKENIRSGFKESDNTASLEKLGLKARTVLILSGYLWDDSLSKAL